MGHMEDMGEGEEVAGETRAFTAFICQDIPSAGERGGGTARWRLDETVPAGRGTDCVCKHF